MEIIIGREGNQQLPIRDLTVSRKHCKVTPNADGTYTIENLSPSGTRVDGQEIIRTTAKPSSRLQLGQSFSATLGELLGQVGQPSAAPKAEAKSFRITHLKPVWEEFNRKNLENASRQQHLNLIRGSLGIFTMGGIIVTSLVTPALGLSLTGIGLAGTIYSFVGLKNIESPEQKQKRQDEFDDKWVCPNPQCRHSLPAKNYKKLVNDYKSCPFCRCDYISE